MYLINSDHPDHPDSPLTHQVVRIDAATASRMLESNHTNRPIRQARVDQYYEDMVCGRWRFNGEAIKFAADGSLLDGQHRLSAITRTRGLVFPMLAVGGLPNDTQVTMTRALSAARVISSPSPASPATTPPWSPPRCGCI